MSKLKYKDNNDNWIAFADENDLATKQDTLVSGTNIKTINNQSILGSGNINITAPVTSVNSRTGAVTVRELPSSTASDSGKFLRVNSSGTAVWETLNTLAGGSY